MTRLSSKGRVVIPNAIRRKLRLEPGAEFVVFGEADTIVLKRVRTPAMHDFDAIIARARQGTALRTAPVGHHCRYRGGTLGLRIVLDDSAG